MNTGRGLAPRRTQSRAISVRVSSSRNFGSLRKSANPREYPRTYQGYSKSAVPLLNREIVTAREFDEPQKIVNFNTAARSIIGGIKGFMESTLKISGPGVLSFMNTEKATVRVNNAKLDIYLGIIDEDGEEEPEPALEIPFAELRAIVYRKANAFQLVFNSSTETTRGIEYKPHILTFTAENSTLACNWVKAVLIGCINTSLFLSSILRFFEQNSEQRHNENQEAFLRQIVDLNTLGRGLIHEETIASQRSLATFLSEAREDKEAEFWRKLASDNEKQLETYDGEVLGGLARVRSQVNKAILQGGIELDADYKPERRGSFLSLPAMFAVRRGANKATRASGSSGKKSRTSTTSRTSELSQGSARSFGSGKSSRHLI